MATQILFLILLLPSKRHYCSNNRMIEKIYFVCLFIDKSEFCFCHMWIFFLSYVTWCRIKSDRSFTLSSRQRSRNFAKITYNKYDLYLFIILFAFKARTWIIYIASILLITLYSIFYLFHIHTTIILKTLRYFLLIA